MKTPESCENSVRNRKRRENVPERSVKNSSKSSESEVEQPQEENLKIKDPTEKPSRVEEKNVEERNFRLKLEFDPMSIVLFTLAVVTRFHKLSEPRNVV